MATTKRKPSFTGNENALYKAIPPSMLKWRPKMNMTHERYWSITFSKPYEFKHKENEKVWYFQLWLWDTEQRKFTCKIATKEQYPPIQHHHIDYVVERIAICSEYSLHLYSFDGNLIKSYAHSFPKRKTWECKFIDANTFLTESAIGWTEIFINRNEKYDYVLGSSIKINEDTYIIHDGASPYTIVISRFHQSPISAFKVTVWEGSTKEGFIRNRKEGFTLLNPTYCQQVAEIALRGYIPTHENRQISIENGYLKIGNSTLFIDDFKDCTKDNKKE